MSLELSVTQINSGMPAAAPKGEYAVSSYTFTQERSVGGTDAPPLVVTIQGKEGLLDFLSLMSAGHMLSASLRDTGDTTGELLFQLDLGKAFVSQVSAGNGDQYDVSISYGAYDVLTTHRNETGRLVADPVAGFDFIANRPTIDVAGSRDVQQSGAAGAGTLVYYISIDGIVGDSTDPGHAGWFELPSFSFGATGDTEASRGHIGTMMAEPLAITLSQTALVPLLEAIAPGDVIKGVRILGFTSADAPKPAFELNLSQVVLQNVQDEAEGVSASLDYAQLGIRTFEPNGHLADTFGWNYTSNQAIDPIVYTPQLGGQSVTAAIEPKDFTISIDRGTTALGTFTIEGVHLSAGAGSRAVPGSGKPPVTEKPDIDTVTLDVAGHAGLTGLIRLLNDGAATTATVRGYAPDASNGQNELVYVLDLSSARIQNIEFSGNDVADHYAITLSAGALELATFGRTNGTIGETGSISYDLVTEQRSDPIAGAAALPPAAGGAKNFLLYIDGIAGTSQSAGFEGWFELAGFDGGMSATAGAHSSAAPIGLTVLDANTAVGALLAKAAAGETIAGARIVGFSAGANPIITYDLRLADVRITSLVEEGNNDGQLLSLSLAYQKIGLATVQGDQSGNGTGWNYAAGGSSIAANVYMSPSKTTAADSVNFHGLDLSVSRDNVVLGKFAVSGFGFGEDVDLGALASGSSVGAGHANPKVATFHLDSMAGLTGLLSTLSTGSSTTMTLRGYADLDGGGSGATYVVDFGRAVVTDITASTVSGGAQGYDLTIAFGAIDVTTARVNPAGTLDAPVETGFDFINQSAGASVASSAVPTTAAPIVAEPNSFLLQLNGFTGDTTVENYAGYFDVDAFKLALGNGIDSVLNTRAGTSGGAVDGSLVITLQSDTALGGLLQALDTGAVLPGATIVGLMAGGGRMRQVQAYELRVGEVTVSSIVTRGETVTVTLGYERVGITTYTQGANGAVSAQTPYAWNLATDRSIAVSQVIVAANVSAATDTYAAIEDKPLVVTAATGVLANDTVAASTRTAVLVSGPAHGTLAFNSDGSFTYQPAANYNGADSFTYRASDGTSTSQVTTVNLTVAPIADAPVAMAFAGNAAENGATIFDTTGHVGDVDAGDTYVVSAATVSGGGSVGVTGTDHRVTFDPGTAYDYLRAGQTATATISYTVKDSTNLAGSSSITVTITGANDAPVANDDRYAGDSAFDIREDTPRTFVIGAGVLGNDTDVDAGTILQATLVSNPSKGMVTLNADGSFSYVPNTNANGLDSFTYRAGDGTANSNLATVTVNIASVNDAPTGANGIVSGSEDDPVVFTVADFPFADAADGSSTAGGNAFAGIVVGALPTRGALTVDGVAVTTGQFIAAATITAGHFSYVGAQDGSGVDYARFGFQVRDDGGTASGGVDTDPTMRTLQINLSPDSTGYSLNSPSVTEGDDGATARNLTFTLTRTGPTDNSDVFYVTYADGTATTADNDYAAGQSMITIPAGRSRVDFDVAVRGDYRIEGNETVNVSVYRDAAKTALVATSSGTIANDDVAGTITIGSPTIAEGDTGTTDLVYTVTRTGGSGDVSFTLATTATGSTATAEADYTATSTTYTLTGGQTGDLANVVVRVIGDTIVEPNETVNVVLSAASNIGLTSSGGVGTIRNDDAAYAIGNANTGEGNSGITPLAFTVTRATAGFATTLYAVPVSGTATAGSDFVAGAVPVAFDATATTATFSIPLIGDTVVEPTEGFTVNLYSDMGQTVLRASTTGTIVNDDLAGNVGNATVYSPGGQSPTLTGGTGDDTYVIVSGSEVITDTSGHNAVYSPISYTLNPGAAIELLSTQSQLSTEPINLIGNSFAQQIVGNFGNNVLNGNGGADTLIGLKGDDIYAIADANAVIVEAPGEGYDIVYTQVSCALTGIAAIEELSFATHGATTDLNIIGNQFDQKVIGNFGNNVLNGNGGVDTLIGLRGDDTYVVNDPRAVVIESAGEGNDTVYVNGSYALGAGVSVETLSTATQGGNDAYNLSGNEFAQKIIGNYGANVIDDGAGADTLIGLYGADTFRFSTPLGAGDVDTIADFESGTDRISLSSSVFTGLASGTLAASAFTLDSTASGTAAQVIYIRATGQLYFDADGSGSGAAVLFATVTPGTVLNAGMFAVG